MSKSNSRTKAKLTASQTVDYAREIMIRLGCPDLFAPPTASTEDPSCPPCKKK